MKRINVIKILFLPTMIGCTFLFSACKKNKADATIFLDANPVTIITDKVNQGGATNNITDLWVYTNGKFIGAYPVGSRIPIITNNDNVKINIEAGIKNNGIAGTRLSYVFYDYLTIDTLLQNGSVITKPLIFKYNPNTKFEWHEDFDVIGYSLINSSVSQAILAEVQTSESLDMKYGFLELDNGAIIAQVESSTDYTLATGNPNVYLEFDYKTNNGFEVGLIGGGTNLKSALIVNPKDNWNHIYISLANTIGVQPVSSSYRIYFKMTKAVDVPKLYLDNIRLVHF